MTGFHFLDDGDVMKTLRTNWQIEGSKLETYIFGPFWNGYVTLGSFLFSLSHEKHLRARITYGYWMLIVDRYSWIWKYFENEVFDFLIF